MAAVSTRVQPWVDKYRPKNIGEVAHQDEVIKALGRALESTNLPHLLFYGPPGTGKTSTALAIARQLYGPDLFKTRVLELNASDERGIGVVRSKIKDFAAGAVGPPAPGHPCPPFKLLILDEADAMTAEAQGALRRTMETHSRVTRFVFICNYVSRIIDPLTSRCAKFRFQPLVGGVMNDRIVHICTAEGVTLAPGALPALARVSGGDLRKAITTLQSAACLAAGAPVTPATLDDVSGAVPDAPIAAIMAACAPGKVWADLTAAVGDAVAEGWPALGLLLGLQAAVVAAPGLPPAARAAACTALAAADKALADGADESVQLVAAAAAVREAVRAGPPAVPAGGGGGGGGGEEVVMVE